MKKIIFFLLAALAVVSCNDDDCNHFYSGGGITYDFILGSWYDLEVNEEIHYSTSGTFYDKYCNHERAAETSGRFEVSDNGKRLTYRYTFMGQNQLTDFKVSDVTSNSFTLSSDYTRVYLHRIVDSHSMKIGESLSLSQKKTGAGSYESTNDHVAAVSEDGIVLAKGEKGTAYIKIPTDNNFVWEKVVVGDDCLDFWIDYSVLLGKDYNQMKSLLGSPETIENHYEYYTLASDYLDGVAVWMDNAGSNIRQIELYLREGVIESEVLSYMNSHYYSYKAYGNQQVYTTATTLEASRAVYIYEKENKIVWMIEAEEFMDQIYWWPKGTCTVLFGADKEAIAKKMAQKGFTFYQSYDAYSLNGSDAYLIQEYEDVYAIEFIYNPDNVMSEYWVYLSDQSEQFQKAVYQFLRENYNEADEENIRGSGLLYFYNEGKTLKVTFNLLSNAVIFSDLTQKPVDRAILGNYQKGIGMTKNELIQAFGEPFLDQSESSGRMIYLINNDYVSYVIFIFDASHEKVYLINLYHKEDVSADVITSYFNKLYTFHSNGTGSNGPYTKWMNADSYAKATLLISYFSDYGVVAYQHPSTASKAPKINYAQLRSQLNIQ